MSNLSWKRCVLFNLALCTVALPQTGICASPSKRFESLARAGRIHAAAPVKAIVEVIADAPASTVWTLLADIIGWPRWQSGIASANAPKPLAIGSNFDWSIDGSPVHSRIERLEAGHRLAWISFTDSRQTIHVWTLEELPRNRTRISSSESMDGIQLPLTSKELADSDQAWLNALKSSAEKQAAANAHQP